MVCLKLALSTFPHLLEELHSCNVFVCICHFGVARSVVMMCFVRFVKRRLAEQLSARIDSYSMVCAYCACKLGHDSVNTVCPVNSPANAATLAMSAAVSGGSGHGEDAPEAQVGSRRHYFVRVSAK